MVLILDGNIENFAHAIRKIGLFRAKNLMFNGSRSNQMPYPYQITEIAPFERAYFYVTI